MRKLRFALGWRAAAFGFLLLALMSLAPSTATAGDGISRCQLRCIHGWDRECDRSKALLGELLARDPAHLKVLLIAKHDELFVGSNYRGDDIGQHGRPEFNPVKSVLSAADVAEFHDSALVALAVILDTSDQANFLRYLERTEFIVDRSVVEHPKYSQLDFARIHRVFVQDGRHRRRARVVSRRASDTVWATERAPGLLAEESAPGRRAFDRANNESFTLRNAGFLSLIEDSATTTEFSSLPNSTVFTGASESELAVALRRYAGKRVALLAHVEGQDVVVRGANGAVKFSIAFDRLERLASDANVELLFLGCDSSSLTTGVGAAGRFNSVEMVQRLKRAIAKRTYGEFLSTLASPHGAAPDLDIVVGAGSFARRSANVATAFPRDGTVGIRPATRPAFVLYWPRGPVGGPAPGGNPDAGAPDGGAP